MCVGGGGGGSLNCEHNSSILRKIYLAFFLYFTPYFNTQVQVQYRVYLNCKAESYS